MTDGSHDGGFLTKQGQTVGDVGCTPTTMPVQRLNQEAEADLIDLFGDDVLAKVAWKGHQIVVRNRTGDDDAHILVLRPPHP